MFFLFLRLCPWILAGVAAVLSWWQWRVPTLYPWPLLVLLGLYILACLAFLWRARHWREGALALFPTLTALLLLVFGHLFVETPVLRLFTSALFTFLPWFSLELGWFLLYDSAHYPARSFFRLHVALVPICVWYLLATLQEIHVFLPLVATWMLAAGCIIGILALFAGTVQAWQEGRERRWMWASLLIAIHLVAFMLFLPTSLTVHGALGALLVAIPLRLRYLTRERAVSAWTLAIEGGVFLSLWVAILVTARWG